MRVCVCVHPCTLAGLPAGLCAVVHVCILRVAAAQHHDYGPQSCYSQVVGKIAVGQSPKIAMNAIRAREAASD